MAATKTDFCHFIQCRKLDCCGVLVEEIVGAPQCNECGQHYQLQPMSARRVRRMQALLRSLEGIQVLGMEQEAPR